LAVSSSGVFLDHTGLCMYNTLQTINSMHNKPLTQNTVEILQWRIGKYLKCNVKENLSSLCEDKKLSWELKKKKSDKFFPLY